MKKNIYTIILLIAVAVAVSNAQHAEHYHHAGLFLGAASNISEGHTGAAVGLDYEYMFYKGEVSAGVGGYGEIVFQEHKEFLFGPAIFAHFFHDMKIWAAPSLMFLEATEHDEHYAQDDYLNLTDNGTTRFVMRFGAGYDFHYENLTISPVLNFDVSCCQLSLVYGVVVGLGF